MKTSLTKIFTEFKNFATEHKQIKTFEVKPLSENTAKGILYPLMWIDLQTVNVAFEAGQMVADIPVYMLDKIERDYSNLAYVMADALLQLDDLYSIYNDSGCTLGFYFNDNEQATPVVLEFDDLVAGYSMIFKCQILNGLNINEVPIND
jgi:hypothetical protein